MGNGNEFARTWPRYPDKFNEMPRLPTSTRRTVVALWEKGMSARSIKKRLEEEQVDVSLVAIYKLLRKFKQRGTVADLPRSRTPGKLSHNQLVFIDNVLADNDELTARQIHDLLEDQWPEVKVSLSTVKRARKDLGWIATRPKYCQLIRESNTSKRKEWCEKVLKDGDKFKDVVFTDECTVQQDSHGRLCFRKKKQPRKLKPRPKHPVKIHLWAGISYQGATPAVLFTGIMNSTRFCSILEKGLMPFLSEVYPDGHGFQQDNDPKHCSNYTKKF